MQVAVGVVGPDPTGVIILGAASCTARLTISIVTQDWKSMNSRGTWKVIMNSNVDPQISSWLEFCLTSPLYPAPLRYLLNDDVDILLPWRRMNLLHRSHLTILTLESISCQTTNSFPAPEDVWNCTFSEVEIELYSGRVQGILLKIRAVHRPFDGYGRKIDGWIRYG